MKACIIYFDESGKAEIVKSGVPSVLVKEVNKIRSAEDFPEGVEVVEVWSRVRGSIKRVTRGKLAAYRKHQEDYEAGKFDQEEAPEYPEGSGEETSNVAPPEEESLDSEGEGSGELELDEEE